MHRILLFDHFGLLLIYQLLDALKVGKIDLLVRLSKFEKSLLHDFYLLPDALFARHPTLLLRLKLAASFALVFEKLLNLLALSLNLAIDLAEVTLKALHPHCLLSASLASRLTELLQFPHAPLLMKLFLLCLDRELGGVIILFLLLFFDFLFNAQLVRVEMQSFVGMLDVVAALVLHGHLLRVTVALKLNLQQG